MICPECGNFIYDNKCKCGFISFFEDLCDCGFDEIREEWERCAHCRWIELVDEDEPPCCYCHHLEIKEEIPEDFDYKKLKEKFLC